MTNPLFDALLAPHRDSAAPFASEPDGRTLSYADFLQLAARAAAVLDSHGLKPDDRLILQVEKSLEALAIYAACIARGVVFVPLNTAYTPPEMAYFISDAAPSMVIVDPARKADTDAPGAPLLTLSANGKGSFADAMPDHVADGLPTPHQRETDDLAAILYTSGTTGRSKGAMLTHGNLLSNAQALVETWHITPDDVLLHALPIFHAHGLFVAINTSLLSGNSLIFLPKFDLENVLNALPNATTMMGVPTFYTRLLGDKRFDRDAAAHMRLFISGSAPLLAETHIRFEDRTGLRILERYGMTETGMNTSNPYVGERRAGTVGQPLPGTELRVMDGDTPVGRGEIGTIEVRGPHVFKGYWKRPQKTAEELRPDGWFITGDLGTIDADGYVTIVGRGKDLIISGGYNIYPKEVEDVLDRVSGVVESAVIGVPHADFGEGVVAVLSTQDALDLDTVRQAAAESLADYKRPKRYVVVDELPRNTMGKVQKAALRETHAEMFT